VGQAAKELREWWRKYYTKLLDLIFDEYAAEGLRVGPDEAMDCMEYVLERQQRDVSGQGKPDDAVRPRPVMRFNAAAYRRDAHHYAVDRYYRTYHARGRGGEPLSMSHVDRILSLRLEEGLSIPAIADRLGLRRDTAKYQVAVAEKRRNELIERLEEFRKLHARMFSPDTQTAAQSSEVSAPQPKDQTVRKRPRK
jgi:hypothetical protein